MKRTHRTKLFREQVEDEWTEHFWKFIENNIDKPWDWKWLSQNPNITFDIILAHPDKSWNWYWLSLNPNITFDIVLAHPDKPWKWGWDGLSCNPNIAFDNVLAHSDKPWNWSWLSSNPNLTFDIVLVHPNKPWDWRELSYNTFSKEKQQFIDRKYKEHLSAYRIQQCWNRAISIPTNPMCKRKQKRDYEKCFGRLCR